MGASNPHVLVVVDYSNESAQLFLVGWRGDLQDGFNLVGHGLDSILGDPVAQKFKLASSKEGFLGVDFKSCLLQSSKDLF